MPRDFTVIAIISAYNEEDVIGQAVRHLIDQGIGVYLLDHGSTDDTVAEVKPYLGRGLLRIEALPAAEGQDAGDAEAFAWASVLRRKEALARELDATWFIHHDADEFRESPWPDVRLRDAIERVDALGYNAIDFDLLNFWPTHDDFRRGQDVRQAFTFYEPPQPWDKVQVKCWKKLDGGVDLVSTGGHDASFAGRRVFPLRFILRHYPVRGQSHGERKVFRERRPRFAGERARGWHCQYDALHEGMSFIRDPATLTVYDPDAVRLHLVLRHRGVEELEQAMAVQRGQLEDTRRAVDEVSRLRQEELEAHRRGLEELGQAVVGQQRMLEESHAALAGLRVEMAAYRRTVEELQRTVATQQERATARGEEVGRLNAMLSGAQQRVEALYTSRSWRWMAPLRALQRFLTGG